ncbi:FAD/NAD(P)-binding domain-containing protein [Aulographum hederae CBS 113979]|uniref:FAD/NAD(P)-binding domain-containing protein n=1 Tax=Aulographum hederae CBS 113979 TaxID=1176131 RepID=A0A6G1HC05_9PEZI|nr:FAD/NAD(P)-binding domain-containing protein [Aulographum hederae CBS 113979]
MADFLLPNMHTPQNAVQKRLAGPIHAERHVRVICIGAGASGLLLAYKLQRHFQNFSLTVYEKNEEVSGTWYENKYPGCACDVPAHNYTWSFEPKLDWSAVYAGSREIYDYFNGFTKKHGLDKFIKTKHQVSHAKWNDSKAGYDVQVKNLRDGSTTEDYCDILVNASGILNNWRWPAIPGLHDYKGTLLHTANWDPNIDLRGKHVGLIGNGSSGIQVLPTIQPHVEQVTTFIREPTWVSPVQGLEQHVFSAEEKEAFANKPGELLDYRKNVERGLNGQFGIFLKDTKTNTETHAYMKAQMKEKLKNDFLEQKLIPEWAVGCRRLTPGVGYLESLGKPNVNVVYGEINKVTEKGCVCDDGKEYPIDVLICATGFDTSFKPRFPVINGEGKNLQDEWALNAESYMGVAASGFPNYMIFLGPNCPIGNGPVLCAIECQADYICKLIDRYQTHNIRTFAPTKDAISDFVAHKDEFMKRSVWADPCRSWYKAGTQNPDTITALWPGSTLHYMEALAALRMEDYEVKYQGNRFAWLGNGYSQTELDDTADWAYYIREHDDGEPLSLDVRRRILNKSGTVASNVGVNFSGKDTGGDQVQSKI